MEKKVQYSCLRTSDYCSALLTLAMRHARVSPYISDFNSRTSGYYWSLCRQPSCVRFNGRLSRKTKKKKHSYFLLFAIRQIQKVSYKFCCCNNNCRFLWFHLAYFYIIAFSCTNIYAVNLTFPVMIKFLGSFQIPVENELQKFITIVPNDRKLFN